MSIICLTPCTCTSISPSKFCQRFYSVYTWLWFIINVGLLSTDICSCILYNHVIDLTRLLHLSIAYGKEMNFVVFTIISPYAKTYTNVITR